MQPDGDEISTGRNNSFLSEAMKIVGVMVPADGMAPHRRTNDGHE